jgi:hypothetical protein
MNTPHLQPQINNDTVEQGEILPDPLPQTQPEPPLIPQATQPLASVKPPAKTAFNSKDMASLAGLDMQADPAASAIVATEQQENIDAAKTQLPIYKQSVFKTITIGSSLLIATVILGKLVFPTKDVPAVAQKAPTPIEQSQADFAPDPRFGVVNSKLAMNDQSKQIMDAASAQQTLANQKPGSGTPVANTAPAPATNPSKVDSNPEVVKNTAPPVNSEYQAPPPIATAPAQPIAIAPKPVAPAQPIAAAPKPVTLAAQPIAVVPKTRIAPVVRPPVQIAARQIQLAAPRPTTPAKVQVTWDVANRNAVGLWNWRSGDAAVAATMPNTQNPTSIKPRIALTRTIPAAVGQQIKSKLVVPYQSPTSAPTQLIFIGLSTPVLDIRGEVLLPAGTQIMCEVAAMDNGMLQVSSAKASIDGQLIELPKQSIILQDASKQPLIAQLKTFGQGEVFNRDLYTIAGGMANAIGQNLTQPQTQTIATAGGIVQGTNPSINLTGAALSGFAPVVSQWMQRNQSAITQINAASKIWFLPTGSEINLVIAQPFTL